MWSSRSLWRAARALQPGLAVMAMNGTPTSGRSDLVGVTMDGERFPMALGDRKEVGTCGLTLTWIHVGENRADFLWRCE